MAEPRAIQAVRIKGYKSFADEKELKIRPLTLLAGANSSGKSSALQPLLLLKQTLEAPYDPGRCCWTGRTYSSRKPTNCSRAWAASLSPTSFEIALEAGPYRRLREHFRRNTEDGVDLVEMSFANKRAPRIRGKVQEVVLRPGMHGKEVSDLFAADLGGYFKAKNATWEVRRERCFSRPAVNISQGERESFNFPLIAELDDFAELLLSIIHIPGLRGNPARTYRTTAVGRNFFGTFPIYTASLLLSWRQDKDPGSRMSTDSWSNSV